MSTQESEKVMVTLDRADAETFVSEWTRGQEGDSYDGAAIDRISADVRAAIQVEAQPSEGEGTKKSMPRTPPLDHWLCGACGEVTERNNWTGLVRDEETDELRPARDSEEWAYDVCPACCYRHWDDDGDPGVWDGTRSQMEQERATLIPDYLDLWIERWKDLVADLRQPDPQPSVGQGVVELPTTHEVEDLLDDLQGDLTNCRGALADDPGCIDPDSTMCAFEELDAAALRFRERLFPAATKGTN